MEMLLGAKSPLDACARNESLQPRSARALGSNQRVGSGFWLELVAVKRLPNAVDFLGRNRMECFAGRLRSDERWRIADPGEAGSDEHRWKSGPRLHLALQAVTMHTVIAGWQRQKFLSSKDDSRRRSASAESEAMQQARSGSNSDFSAVFTANTALSAADNH